MILTFFLYGKNGHPNYFNTSAVFEADSKKTCPKIILLNIILYRLRLEGKLFEILSKYN